MSTTFSKSTRPLLDCRVDTASSGEHNSQLFTGLAMLVAQGKINISVPPRSLGSLNIGTRLDLIVNESVRITYDLSDGGTINPEHGIDDCDIYFKRSYDARSETHPQASKIHRLGLNYPVFGPRDWAARRLIAELRLLRPMNAKEKMVGAARLSRLASRLLGLNGGRWPNWIDQLTARPQASLSPRALLLTQTWDPETQKDAKTAAAWRELNATRVECIRLLRRQFGQRFVGGLRATDHARREFSKYVMPPAMTRKVNYLRLVASSDVCITTAGLARSNGWRLAEYVAMSRSIVTEPLHYSVPGAFEPSVNYLEMQTPRECIDHTLRLLDDHDLRFQMMEANHIYYNEYVRPDALVWHSLAETMIACGLGDDAAT